MHHVLTLYYMIACCHLVRNAAKCSAVIKEARLLSSVQLHLACRDRQICYAYKYTLISSSVTKFESPSHLMLFQTKS